MESFVKRTIGDSARVMEAVFNEERTTDELIDAIADLAAGLNPVVRDARNRLLAILPISSEVWYNS